jgi:hypothetical protein
LPFDALAFLLPGFQAVPSELCVAVVEFAAVDAVPPVDESPAGAVCGSISFDVVSDSDSSVDSSSTVTSVSDDVSSLTTGSVAGSLVVEVVSVLPCSVLPCSSCPSATVGSANKVASPTPAMMATRFNIRVSSR